MVESADDAIISNDIDGMITSWNSSAERMFGYTAAEAIGQNITVIIPPEHQEEEAKLRGQLKQGGRVDHVETLRRRKGGTIVEVSLTISPVQDADGSVIGVLKVLRDIRERKEEQRGNRLLAAVVESSDDAIVSKNLDGVITSWNSSAEKMFGYTAAEAIGQHITMIIPPDRRSEETGILERLRQGKRIDHFETIRMRKDGTLLDISLAISPVRDGTGRVVGASKVARDITERKRIDRALRESEEQLRLLAEGLEDQIKIRTQELEERNAEVVAQSALLRELSTRLLKSQDDERRRIARELHDSAGQVLTALGISLSNMGQHALNDPELAKDLQDAQEILQALNKEIRTMSYLLHPPLLDENGLLEALRWYIDGLSERSGLQIELDAGDNIGRLPSEMELTLFRIVQECMTNIHRHSGSKTATIRLAREASEISLEIQDQGKGIPAAKLANIQAQRSGVGLTGIRERVRDLRGVVTIASDERGTKISVTLPVSKAAAPVAEEMREPTRAIG
jgi:PAS domain S-box-containing protein